MRLPSLRALCGACLLAGWSLPICARELCPERPGQTTPPCTVDSGRVLIETSFADWSLQKMADNRSETITLGQTAVRIGVADHAELAVGWTPFATTRSRDLALGLVDHQTGVGDVTLAFKRSFGAAESPNVAVKAYAMLPIGGSPAGAGDWAAGLQLPISFPMRGDAQLALTPEMDAAVNSSGTGRHLAFGGAAGLGVKLSANASLGGDIRVLRDDDPVSHTTSASVGTSLSLQRGENLQLDVGGNFGLNENSPAAELYLGISKRF